ncbi:MAG: nucleotidyltransferase substrate binding protein [Alphaproteobacteria bacterium]|nr:nucleotidyltransferase substrate binding protein [Alphaproteobacteria bacterium]
MDGKTLDSMILEKAAATLIKGHAIYCAQLAKHADVADLETYRDSVLKRFEYTFETAKKLIKQHLPYQRSSLAFADHLEFYREAMQRQLINNAVDWLKFQEIRQRILHDYTYEFSYQVIDIVPKFLTCVADTVTRLRKLETEQG